MDFDGDGILASCPAPTIAQKRMPNVSRFMVLPPHEELTGGGKLTYTLTHGEGTDKAE